MSRRVLRMSEAELARWPGVVPYRYDPTEQTTAKVEGASFADTPASLYEIAVVPGDGSWWLPVAAAADPVWTANGGSEPLRVTGTGIPATAPDGGALLRPTALLFWVPDAALLGSGAGADYEEGAILGDFPDIGPNPPDGGGSNGPDAGSIAVQHVPGGLEIVVPPGKDPVTVRITSGS